MQKVLLCRPDFFQVDYQINPWMKIGAVNPKLARHQWTNLVHCYQQNGLTVEIIPQDQAFPDMVFAADQGIWISENKILLSRFRHRQRAGESTIYQSWYQAHGYQVITLPDQIFFEGGGELQRWRDQVLIGTGFRANQASAQIVGQLLRKKVITLQLIDQRFYHLDTCLFVLDNDTIFYYPPAFGAPALKLLPSLVPSLIPISQAEIENFAANSVIFASTVLIQQGNPVMTRQLQALGYTVIELDISEFFKAGGGLHCLTGELR